MAKAHKLADGRYECQNCLRKFTKQNEQTYIDPKFCCDPCRKEFHANGGLSLKRVESRVRQWVRDEWAAIRHGYEQDPATLTNLLNRMLAIESHPKLVVKPKTSNGHKAAGR